MDTLENDELKLIKKWDDARGLVVGYAASQIGCKNPTPYYESAGLGTDPAQWPKHWCGIFCLWALHQAGLGLDWEWDFKPAERKWGFLWRLERTRDPKPGDVAYFDGKQHHAIVMRVEPDRSEVTTIDGNQTGGVVARRTRPYRSVSCFYSIAPLLQESPTP